MFSAHRLERLVSREHWAGLWFTFESSFPSCGLAFRLWLCVTCRVKWAAFFCRETKKVSTSTPDSENEVHLSPRTLNAGSTLVTAVYARCTERDAGYDGTVS